MLKAPAKITFKNSTKMTLNARFTNIMKSHPPTNPQTVKTQASIKKVASEKNRRLAQQMENRPTVEAALGTTRQPPPSLARVSVLDRLGTVKTRGRGRISASNSRGGFRSGNQFKSQSVVSTRARGILRGALRRGNNQGRGGSLRGKSFPMQKRGNKTNNSSFRGRGSFRGKRGFRGRGGRGTTVNKTTLDKDLDSYMSKTKGSMDAELDAYMANAGGD